MRSKFKTTVYTYSTESLFEKYKKISEKAVCVKLGSFLQSAYEKLI